MTTQCCKDLLKSHANTCVDLLAQRCTDNKFCTKKFLSCLPPIPGRPRAMKPAEITSLMPLHPNTRDNGKSTDPPRAEYLAPHTAVNTAVNTQTPLHKTPSHLDHNDAVPQMVLGVQGRDYELCANNLQIMERWNGNRRTRANIRVRCLLHIRH